MASLKDCQYYKAYLEIIGVPHGAPDYATLPNGRVIVEMHEVKCRRIINGVRYGVVVGSRGALCNHLKKQHDLDRAPGLDLHRPSHADVMAAKAFYKGLMDRHDQILKQENAAMAQRAQEIVAKAGQGVRFAAISTLLATPRLGWYVLCSYPD
ncbi:hypothetical protein BU23DRAFT_550424 [Bimuria novae-zelandiae CBS 107.79]|uniref:Uncharacterized protein n=1 Tax=Bimuria novae-zelandiae CBS 107.79 TaxID=1447943 RepID=A0A6A5VMP1_9PLEO|nr:hypothetical protein BU23DRAFT_550424 [Bimuria novae-zelandiae CBS 107.79]